MNAQCAPTPWSGTMLQNARGFHSHASSLFNSVNAAAFGYRAGVILSFTSSQSGVAGAGLVGLRIGRRYAAVLVEAPGGGGVGGGGI